MRIFISLLAAALAVAFAGGALAQQYEEAERRGDVDLSYACPSGSTWYPQKGGQCLSNVCADGWRAVGPTCQRKIGELVKVAKYVYTRKITEKSCRKGTFSTGLTLRCYKSCPKGYKTIKEARSCVRAPEIKVVQKKVVAEVSLAQLLDPTKAVDEIGKLGCHGKPGETAFFDRIDGGGCWVCPADYPVRTLFSVKGKKACASNSCGKQGGRPCYVWERPLSSCDAGLLEDPFSNTCVPDNQISCRALLGSVNALNAAIEKANAAGEALEQAALDKVPGLAAAMRFVENQAAHIDKAMDDIAALTPMEEVVEALETQFPTPDSFDTIRRTVARMADRKSDFQAALLDEDAICTGDLSRLEDLFGDVVVQASLMPEGGRRFALGDLLGVSPAHAASDGSFFDGWSVAYTFAPTINARINGVPVPMVPFGIQAAVKYEENRLAAAVYYVVGADLVAYPAPDPKEVGDINHLVTFTWPEALRFCEIENSGLGVMFGRIGVGIGCTTPNNLSVLVRKTPIPTPAEMIRDAVKDQLAVSEPKKIKTSGSFSVGPNLGILVVRSKSAVAEPAFAFGH